MASIFSFRLHCIVLGLPRCRSSTFRIEVEVNAFLIGQSSLDLSSHVIGEHLIAAGFDCTQHLPDYLQRLDLWKSKLTRHVRVNRTGVHAHNLCALLAKAVPQPIRQSPSGRLGSTVRSGAGNRHPTQYRQNIDDSTAAVLRQDWSKGTTEQERPKEERTELLDKKQHKALEGMEVQSADGKRCGFDDVELVRVRVTRGGGFKPVRT
jgi:hypothetical protein